MNKTQEAIVLAQFNSAMNDIQLFRASTSTDWETLNYPAGTSRIKILELYLYLYKHPDTIVSLLKMDRSTFYFDKFVANNVLTSIGGIMIGMDKSPSDAIKEFKRQQNKVK